MSKITNTTKIRIPAIKVITIPDNRVIHIDDQIFGELVVKLINDDGSDYVKGCEIKMPEYSGEYGCFITAPKAWVNKTVLVKYEREGERVSGPINIDGFEIDCTPDKDDQLNKKNNLIDEFIRMLDKFKEQNPDQVIIMETPSGAVECRIGDANIYDDPYGKIIIDAE